MINAAAADAILRGAWTQQRHIAELPAECRPTNRQDGYAVQALVEKLTTHALFGWKIAATSKSGQAHIGVDGPMAGRLLKERVIERGTPIALRNNLMAVAEPEFAFVMDRDLTPRDKAYGLDEVLGTVRNLHLAVEIPDSRFTHFAQVGEAQLIADNACAHEFVLGPVVSHDWRKVDLSRHAVHAEVVGKDRSYSREGVGSNVLGGPLIALTWLANELSSLQIALQAGQVITTGTCMPPLEVFPGDRVSLDYGVFGAIDASFV